MPQYLGLVQLESTITGAFVAKSGSVPYNAATLPTYRIYGPGGLMTNGTGSVSFQNHGTITAATNASPIVITSTAHGLTTGTIVTISGVGGNTNANGTWTITVVDANTFSLNGSTGNSAYTSGGVWNVTGVYNFTIAATSANGYVAGQNYTVVLNGNVNSANWGDTLTFSVV